MDAFGFASFTLVTPVGSASVRLSLPGRHNVANALAATAATLALGLDLATICRGLEQVQPVKGRFCIHRLPGLTLIDRNNFV